MQNFDVQRRQFLKDSAAASLGLAALPTLRGQAAEGAAGEAAELAAARKTARQRRRRLIYNDDGCGPLGYPTGGTPEGFLYGPNSRMGALKESQVDSVFICSGSTHVLNHKSAVAESYADVSEKYQIGAEWERYRDNIRALEKAGTDPIQLTIDFCRKEAREVFYSHRINDIHNTFLDIERSTWFREHPEYWLATPEEAAKAGGINNPRHWWSALNFDRPEVLEYLCQIQQDVCQRFDLDGVDIDYFRSPLFFPTHLDFKPATDQQTEILTEFQRRLHAIHVEAGVKRGRPMLTAARVPATIEKCEFLGIDIKRWLKEGLVDVLVLGGGYVPFTEPIDELVKTSHAAEIPVYGCISNSGMRGAYSTVEGWRGAASNLWRAGVDGIETFNLFPSEGPEPRLQDIGSVETLAGKNKLFAIDNERILEGDLVFGIEQSQLLPALIPGDGQAATAILPVGDDLASAAKEGTLASAELQIKFSKPEAIDAIETSFNGHVLAPVRKDAAAGWLVFHPPHDQFRVGRNEIQCRGGSNVPSELAVTSVELSVAYN